MAPACQRSIFVLSTGMLLFAAKLFGICGQTELIRLLLPCDVDPHLGISEDFQVYVKLHTDAKMCYSLADNEEAVAVLAVLKQKIIESNDMLLDMIVRSLSHVTKLEADDTTRQLSQGFTLDESYMFYARMCHDSEHVQRKSESEESLTSDEDVPAKVTALPSVTQLLDSSLEVARQVAATTVSTSPIPYTSMISQCEALETNRKRLTDWLVYDKQKEDSAPGLAMKLPPASPFDNFWRAAHLSQDDVSEL